jgi:hypothetical protein
VTNSKAQKSRDGSRAAYGRRKRWRSAVRTRLTWEMLRLARKRRAPRPADYIEFVPGSDDPAVVADVSGRVNWYLRDRTVPVYMSGAHVTSFTADAAPYLDPALVRDPGWEGARPPGRPEIVLHTATPRSIGRFARGSRRATLASATLSLPAERGWFALQTEYGSTHVPSAQDAMNKIQALIGEKATALVLATGPSASLVDPADVTADLRITCNSAVRDHELLEQLRPNVIAFADRVFHFGPSRYAAAFRSDLRAAMENTDATFVTTSNWAGPLLAHMPEIAERLAVLPSIATAEWHWPVPDEPWARATGNVLTSLMLPVAITLADEILIAGCDGRTPDERYFWKHNAQTQYTDDLMATTFAAHPSFFGDRSYVDYYDDHCRELEEILRVAEAAGRRFLGLTPSHIPALRDRGAPPFNA